MSALTNAQQVAIPACRAGPLLIVVEGPNDVYFLKHLSRLVRQTDPNLPDLVGLEQSGSVVFIPFGGGNVLSWCERLAPLGRPEIHIYDREVPPETAIRETAIDRINSRSNCLAFLTRLPTAEHYLLPALAALRNAAAPLPNPMAGIANQFAVNWYSQRSSPVPWHLLPVRRRHRYIQRAKCWLYSHVLPKMTLEQLHAADPEGEASVWFAAIAELLPR